jgi:hypothetical protein
VAAAPFWGLWSLWTFAKSMNRLEEAGALRAPDVEHEDKNDVRSHQDRR